MAASVLRLFCSRPIGAAAVCLLTALLGAVPASAQATSSNVSWSTTPLPTLPGYSGTPELFQRDRRGWIAQTDIDGNRNKLVTDSGASDYPWRRISLESPDASEAIRHRVTTDNIVVALGHTKYFSKPNNFRGALLRFQMYATAFRGRPGKLVEFEGGRGWAGNGPFRHRSDSFHGSDGWGFNAMSGLSGSDQNKLRMLSTFEHMTNLYGHAGTEAASAWPLNQWVTIDLLVDMTDGYRILQDGAIVTAKLGVKPPYQGSDKDCKALGLVWRLMHGGNPGTLLPRWEYSEYFRNFEIFVFP